MGTDNHDSWEKKPGDFKQEDTICTSGFAKFKSLTLPHWQRCRARDILIYCLRRINRYNLEIILVVSSGTKDIHAV